MNALLSRVAPKLAAAALLLVAAALPAAPAWAQDDPETVAAKKVEKAKEIMAEMEGATDSRVYALGAQLTEVAGDEEPVLRAVAEGVTSDQPAIVLACARICLPDFCDVDPLLPLIKDGGAYAVWAAGLAGRLGEKDGAKALRTLFEDATLPAEARRAAARGILRNTPSDAEAVAYLQRVAETAGGIAAREATLHLAEAGHVSAVRNHLKAIGNEPTVEGATARAYLKLDPLRGEIAQNRADVSTLVFEVAQKVEKFYAHETAPDGKTKIDLAYLRDAAGRGMVAHLDRFSQFMTRDDFKKNEERMSGSYGGIGAYVTTTKWRGGAPGAEPKTVLTISQPIYRSDAGEYAPAYESGLRSGDQLVKAKVPEQPEPIDLVGKTVQQCVDLLKGTVGTQVTVWVNTRGSAEVQKRVLTRAKITIDTAPHEMMPGNIGYIRILRFDNKTGRRDLHRALRAMRDQGAKGLLIDLRGNPGGSLDEVVQCADWFLKKGAMVTTLKGRHPRWAARQYRADDEPIWSHPVVVLTNEDSASGAELFPGALRDHGRATIIGHITQEKPTGATFGKGSGQTFLTLQKSLKVIDGEALITRIARMTVFKYYLPGGDSVHETGLIPDLAVKLPEVPEWQFEAADALNQDEIVGHFVDTFLTEPKGELKAQLTALAEFDDFKTGGYPGFAKWAEGLTTKLDHEALRRMVRSEVRLKLADLRAREYLFDYQEDLHLQRGIVEVMRKMEVDAATIKQFKHFANRQFVELAPRKGEKTPKLK
jgi:carboxyl-terminal processing protease